MRLDTSVRCERGHTFDVARQGYVSLLTGESKPSANADTAQMVLARQRFLDAGHFGELDENLREKVAENYRGGLIVDVGAGPGHYLATVLDKVPASGLALDISKTAIRAAARAHPKLGAAVADVRRGLPVVDGAAAILLNVFAPRNAEEFHRALRPGGLLLVVTPSAAHLTELVEDLGLVSVDAQKLDRLDASLAARFELTERVEVVTRRALSASAVADVVLMGPSAHHVDHDELRARVVDTTVTTAFTVSSYRPRV
jgi:23S rRNA (guanine745-N1)-methyltransferase